MSAAPPRAPRGVFGEGTPTRHLLSDHFAMKARSDLEMAQSMATLGLPGRPSDSGAPGLILGTCMHLAQQSLEKTLKSTVFMLYETLCGSYGDDDSADDTIPRSLGHSIYPETCRRYFALIDSLRATNILRGCRYTDALDNSMATDTKRQKTAPDQLDKLWKERSKDLKLQNVAWKHSVGMRLKDSDFQMLELKHKTYASLLANSTCRPKIEMEHLSLDRAIPKISLEECLDASTLERRRAENSRRAPASGLSAALDQEFGECQAGVGGLASGYPRDELYTRTVRRAILEFGFMLLLYHFKPYTAMSPHHTMGRYPRLLDRAHITTDLYGRQAEHVLHHLFVGVPHSVSRLSDYSGRIGALWSQAVGSKFA